MVLRIILFLILSLLGIVGPVWLFVPMLALYIGVYTSVEVLLLTVVIDAYFGYAAPLPGIFTLGAGIGLLLTAILRPYLSVYNR